MLTIQTPKLRKSVLGLALAASVATLSSCAGGSGDGNGGSENNAGVDTRGVTTESLRTSATTGMTQGITANTRALTTVLGDSSALQQLTSQLGSGGGASSVSTSARALGDGPNGLDTDSVSTQIDSALDFVGELIDQSDISQNGNVYTFDPVEAQICANAEDSQAAADCTTVLSHITFVMTVNSVVDQQVVAATTAFKYDNSTFVVVDFSANSGYYEVQLAGLRTLLAGLNEVAPADEVVELPSTMQGTLRVAFTTTGSDSGTLTVSVPAAIRLTDDTEGEALQIDIAQTNQLFSLAADGTAKTMTVEVNISALDLLSSESDVAGSFPVKLALSGITGKAVVTDSGDKLTLTGIGADSVTVKVENTQAASLSLAAFDAVLDASGANAVANFSKALDFNLSLTNLRGIFSDIFESDDPALTLVASVDAPGNTGFETVSDEQLKVTGGTLDIVITQDGADDINVSVPDGSCLDTSGDAPVASSCLVAN